VKFFYDNYVDSGILFFLRLLKESIFVRKGGGEVVPAAGPRAIRGAGPEAAGPSGMGRAFNASAAAYDAVFAARDQQA
jgi:hypothetical protein